MCPLFAAAGSPWTGRHDAPCQRDACGFWRQGHCDGAALAYEGAALGRVELPLASAFDCPHAPLCQWQIEAGVNLCPPRAALAHGVHPHNCRW